MWKIIIKKTGVRIACQDNDDGTCTVWSYSIWGAIGSTGKPAEGICIVEARNQTDRTLIWNAAAMVRRGIERTDGWYNCAKARKEQHHAK